VVVDASGDIYVAGTTSLLDYPTTPGTYQPTFPSFLVCASPVCPLSQGPNQYVTKVDPTGSRLIFSTAVSGTGSTTNAGLAIDKSGNAYLTGFAGAGYPYSVAPPPLSRSPSGSATIPAFPFLSKLDLNGQSLLFSYSRYRTPSGIGPVCHTANGDFGLQVEVPRVSRGVIVDTNR